MIIMRGSRDVPRGVLSLGYHFHEVGGFRENLP